MKKPNEEQLHIFLKESNAIEGVYDEKSLEQAKLAWDYLIEHDRLKPETILRTHAILMALQPLPDRNKGQFRRCAVTVGGRFGANWEQVPKSIQDWCLMSNMPGEDIITLHVVYEKIHPFIDGNGRTGRMFMNWTCCKNDLPLIIFKADEKHKKYYPLFD